MRAKFALLNAMLAAIAGGEDDVTPMLDAAYSQNGVFAGRLGRMRRFDHRFHELVGVMDGEAAPIRAHAGPAGEPPSKRPAQLVKGWCPARPARRLYQHEPSGVIKLFGPERRTHRPRTFLH